MSSVPNGYSPPPRYRGPAEAAADLADLLPPVDYSRPARPAQPAAAPAAPSANGARGPAAAASAPVTGHGLVLLAFGVGAVALAVLMPFAGTVLALAVITLLRAADKAQAGLAARRSRARREA